MYFSLYVPILDNHKSSKYKEPLSKADDRQAISLPVLGAPFLAATLPLAAAGAIGVYGAYQDAIITYFNSLFGTFYNNQS